MAKRKPHALIVAMPFQGHINPLLHLSSYLLSAGFMVTFANMEANHQRILKCHAHPHKDAGEEEFPSSAAQPPHYVGGAEDSSGDGPEVLPAKGIEGFVQQRDGYKDGILHLPLPDRHHERSTDAAGGYLRLVSLEDGFPATFENAAHSVQAAISPIMIASVEALVLRLLQEDHPVSCLVSDLRQVFMQDVGNKFALPWLSFWTQSAATFISNLLLAKGFQPPPDDSTLITTIPGVPPHKRSEVSALFFDGVRYPSMPDEYLYQPFVRISEPEWVAINTYEQLETSTLDSLQEILGFRPLTFGPLVGPPVFRILDGITGSMDAHTDRYMKWLEDHPPASVLYIAFGTVATLSKEQLEELVIGLEASQQPFFWVFRPDLCKNLGSVRVETLLERVKNQGMVVPWAPQWHILHHRSVGGFLTHCGWNSVLEGINAGVPMLGWPQITDQFVNRRCIEEQWGIGLGLKVGDQNGGLVSRLEVEEKVLNLMQGESGRLLREKALALSRKAKDAVADGGSSSSNFERFVLRNQQIV